MKKVNLRNILFSLLFLGLAACSPKKDNSSSNSSFDRKGMLANWADNMIIPAYSNFQGEAKELKNAVAAFNLAPSAKTLGTLRQSWEKAYIAWQKTALFQIGKAQDLNIRFRMNGYPTKVEKIKENIETGNANFELYSNLFAQGFPAIDYMINGVSADDEGVLAVYSDVQKGVKHKTYLSALADNMCSLADAVVNWWANDANKKAFINNSDAKSSSSVNKLVNYAVVIFFEQEIRESKIAFPSGARTNIPEPQKVEAFYKKNISKQLLNEALNAFENFYNGKSFDGTKEGNGLKSYLTSLGKKELSEKILKRLAEIKESTSKLNDDFTKQINENNDLMIEVFNRLQSATLLLKVDMMHSLDIKVTIQDNDGD